MRANQNHRQTNNELLKSSAEIIFSGFVATSYSFHVPRRPLSLLKYTLRAASSDQNRIYYTQKHCFGARDVTDGFTEFSVEPNYDKAKLNELDPPAAHTTISQPDVETSCSPLTLGFSPQGK